MEEKKEGKLDFTKAFADYVPVTYEETNRRLPEKYVATVYWVIAKHFNAEDLSSKYDFISRMEGDRIEIRGSTPKSRAQAMQIAAVTGGVAYRRGKEMCLIKFMVKDNVKLDEVRTNWIKKGLWLSRSRFIKVDDVEGERRYVVEMSSFCSLWYKWCMLHPSELFYTVLDMNFCEKCHCRGHSSSTCGIKKDTPIRSLMSVRGLNALVLPEYRMDRKEALKVLKSRRKDLADYNYTVKSNKREATETVVNNELNPNAEGSDNVTEDRCTEVEEICSKDYAEVETDNDNDTEEVSAVAEAVSSIYADEVNTGNDKEDIEYVAEEAGNKVDEERVTDNEVKEQITNKTESHEVDSKVVDIENEVNKPQILYSEDLNSLALLVRERLISTPVVPKIGGNAFYGSGGKHGWSTIRNNTWTTGELWDLITKLRKFMDNPNEIKIWPDPMYKNRTIAETLKGIHLLINEAVLVRCEEGLLYYHVNEQ